MNIIKTKKAKLNAKRTFLKQGTCSRTFFYILNREFDHPMVNEEQAVDLMAGGILQLGYQCGMLWGASAAIGAESFRRNENQGQAIGISIKATQHIMESFVVKAKSIECEDITETDFSNKWSFAKYLFTGKFYSCFKLAERWAPDAIEEAHKGLLIEHTFKSEPVSCASEVVRKMGGNNEEIVLVAGYAGGLGLSGSGCGALAAAIWMNTLLRVRNGTMKSALKDPIAEKILKAFYDQTDYKIECHEICGKHFNTVEEHTDFVKEGGCDKLINLLADISLIK